MAGKYSKIKPRPTLSLHDLGILIHVPAFMALISLPIALITQHWHAAVSFSALFCLSICPGQLLCRNFERNEELEQPVAMTTVALAWLLIGIMAAFPFWMVAVLSPLGSEASIAYSALSSAIFEGFSGVTSCGLTMSARPDQLPASLQWWRSLLEWVGGVGVVVLALVLTESHSDPEALFEAEGRPARKSNITAVAIRIWKIYLFYTAIIFIALWITGLPAWEALNHGLTAISTGGFTMTQSGLSNYSGSALAVLIIAMIMGALSFRMHSAFWRKGRAEVWLRNTQFRWLAACLIGGTILVLAVNSALKAGISISDSIFQWASALCTCGFSTVTLSEWPAASLLLLMAAMFVGGAAGSTAGGIKLRRAAWIAKGILRQFNHSLFGEKLDCCFVQDGEQIEIEKGRRLIRSAMLLLGLWLSMLTVGSIALLVLLPEATPHHVIFEAISAIGGVGLSTGVASSSMPAAAKLILATLMWMGRLEIIAALAIFVRPCLRLLRSSAGTEKTGSQ